MPFRNIFWDKVVNPITRISSKDLIKEMIIATPRPKSVTKTVKMFRSIVMENKPYIGVHWLYDPDDFGAHCSHAVGPGNAKIFKSPNISRNFYSLNFE